MASTTLPEGIFLVFLFNSINIGMKLQFSQQRKCIQERTRQMFQQKVLSVSLKGDGERGTAETFARAELIFPTPRPWSTTKESRTVLPLAVATCISFKTCVPSVVVVVVVVYRDFSTLVNLPDNVLRKKVF